MQRFLVIGTAHVEDPGLFRALENVFEATRPDQLILEMPDDVAAAGDVGAQKPEMQCAYRWAKRRGIPVRGHEPPEPSILRDGLTPERIGELAHDMDALVRSLSVRRTIDIFCKLDPPKTVAEERLSAVIDELIDPDRALIRTQAIIAAIRRLAAPRGAIMVVCGGNHAPHIAAALPGCQIIHGDHFF